MGKTYKASYDEPEYIVREEKKQSKRLRRTNRQRQEMADPFMEPTTPAKKADNDL